MKPTFPQFSLLLAVTCALVVSPNAHCYSIRGGKRQLACSTCFRKYRLPINLRMHLVIHSLKDYGECPACDYVAVSEQSVNE